MIETVVFRDKEYVVADKVWVDSVPALVLLERGYLVEYDNVGVDTEESSLKLDETPAKTYESGLEAVHIINDETGFGVGFYGIMEDDPELVR